MRELDPAGPGSDARDPLAAQLDAVLRWRAQRGPGSAGADGRRAVSDRLADPAAPRTSLTAVVAHPDDELRAELVRHLSRHDLHVVSDRGPLPGRLPQPADLVLFHAVAVATARRTLVELAGSAPRALLAVQLVAVDGGPSLLGAGARAVFSDRVSPSDVALSLVDCLSGQRDAVLLL